MTVGVAVLIGPAWFRASQILLHDRLTGSRVVRRPRANHAVGTVGDAGEAPEPRDEQLDQPLVGHVVHDDELDRTLLMLPAPQVSAARRAVTRPTRARWVAQTADDGRVVDVFAVPPTSSFDSFCAQRPAWPQARRFLESLVRELAEWARDVHARRGWAWEQVRVTKDGEALLVDGTIGAEYGSPISSVDLVGRAARRLHAAAHDAMRQRAHEAVPWPVHASKLVVRFTRCRSVDEQASALHRIANKPTGTESGSRVAGSVLFFLVCVGFVNARWDVPRGYESLRHAARLGSLAVAVAGDDQLASAVAAEARDIGLVVYLDRRSRGWRASLAPSRGTRSSGVDGEIIGARGSSAVEGTPLDVAHVIARWRRTTPTDDPEQARARLDNILWWAHLFWPEFGQLPTDFPLPSRPLGARAIMELMLFMAAGGHRQLMPEALRGPRRSGRVEAPPTLYGYRGTLARVRLPWMEQRLTEGHLSRNLWPMLFLCLVGWILQSGIVRSTGEQVSIWRLGYRFLPVLFVLGPLFAVGSQPQPLLDVWLFAPFLLGVVLHWFTLLRRPDRGLLDYMADVHVVPL